MEKFIDDSRIHEGHRSRMRHKLLTYGQRIFDTYELLEMLLYQVIPYKDTNPISKRLLYSLGSLDRVLSASAEVLMEQNGIGERASQFLVDVGRLSDILGAEMLTNQGPDLSNYDAVGQYLASYFAGMQEKQVVALYLDSSMRLLSFKKLYDLEYESGGVKPKAFINGAIESSAAVMITAHNHPHGPFYPTLGDRATHAAINDAMRMVGIVHAEHYIICGNHYAGIGSLNEFNLKLSQMPAVGRFIESRDTSGRARVSSIGANDKPSHIRSEGGCNIRDVGYFAKLIGYCESKNNSSIAESLLQKYRTVENTLSADTTELSSIVGDGLALYIKLLAYITSRRVTDNYEIGKPYSKADIAEYLKALFIGEPIEKTYLVCYDAEDRFVGCELLGEGTVSASEVIPRKAIDIALRSKAKSVSLAHNHPFGTTKASNDDLEMTKQFSTLFANSDIRLREHFIVAGQLCDSIEIQE